MNTPLAVVKIAVLGPRKDGEGLQKRWQQHRVRGAGIFPMVVLKRSLEAVSVSDPRFVDVLKVHSLPHRDE